MAWHWIWKLLNLKAAHTHSAAAACSKCDNHKRLEWVLADWLGCISKRRVRQLHSANTGGWIFRFRCNCTASVPRLLLLACRLWFGSQWPADTISYRFCPAHHPPTTTRPSRGTFMNFWPRWCTLFFIFPPPSEYNNNCLGCRSCGGAPWAARYYNIGSSGESR